ncbi:Reverse transcriptase zinc-binding domain [Arabidopsis suecica]|uniref:Reverse transcriptase zinc-binding domain n=1 Tax=Arabidopsis suecica TaxID=45249 RepID=A0A8T1ZWH4_ARASU|nr:Reverse transcriptase zinc-binding domain [Arabidopsis suecica]
MRMDGLSLMLEQSDKFFSTLSSLPLPCLLQMIHRFGLLMVFLPGISLQKLCGIKLARISNPTKFWAPLVWHKAAIPRHAITSWLFILNRNPTLDRLSTWGFDVELDCLLCGLAHETRNHLFFTCAFSAEVWKLITQRLQISSSPLLWDQILLWLPTTSVSKHKKLALLQGWQGAIYELWKERNRRFHDGLSLSPITVTRLIISTMENKCNAMIQLGLKRGSSILKCWIT